MDFASEADVKPDDAVMEYESGFKLVCDPKSLLYLFGLQLDYSNGAWAVPHHGGVFSCVCMGGARAAEVFCGQGGAARGTSGRGGASPAGLCVHCSFVCGDGKGRVRGRVWK